MPIDNTFTAVTEFTILAAHIDRIEHAGRWKRLDPVR